MKLDAASKDYSTSVADAIRRRRLAAGLSMNKLAEGSGLSQPMIGLIERSIHTPTVATLFRIARALSTTPAALLTEVESTPPPPPPAKTARKKSPKPEAATTSSRIKKRPKPP